MTYRNENGVSGNHYVAVGGEISDEAESFLSQNNIRILDESTYTDP